MWHADVAAEAHTKIPLGTRKKAGTQLRSRPHTDKFNDLAVAPKGLPQNCYDERWLSNLPPRTRKELRVRGSAYDFGATANAPAENLPLWAVNTGPSVAHPTTSTPTVAPSTRAGATPRQFGWNLVEEHP
jgi:hypothetical protein